VYDCKYESATAEHEHELQEKIKELERRVNLERQEKGKGKGKDKDKDKDKDKSANKIPVGNGVPLHNDALNGAVGRDRLFNGLLPTDPQWWRAEEIPMITKDFLCVFLCI
jgi:hypothetical protein